MKVSVVIPVYNVERYLVRCLDSVVAAARQFVSSAGNHAVEVVCVDDGSTDNSPARLADYVARQPRQESLTFQILTKPNGGLGSARNAGMDAMTGDWVMFVDSDDYIPGDAISAFAAAAVETGLPLVVSAAFLKDCGRGVSPRSAGGRRDWRIRSASWIAGRKVQYTAWNKFYRADFVRTRRFSEEVRAFEDYPWTTQCLCDVGEIAVVKRPLYVYCINPTANSIIHSPYTDGKLRDSFAGVRAILEHAKGKPSWPFALRQAGDGLSSTIGKIFKTHDSELTRKLLVGCDGLLRTYPGLKRGISPKASIRLWLLRKSAGMR